MESSPGHEFDFFVGSWETHNRRRTAEGVWEEFPSTCEARMVIDGRVQMDKYEATFPSGEQVEGMTVRAYDEVTGEWSLLWLSNRQRPTFDPLVGRFEDGVGLFLLDTEDDEGRPVRWRFVWDEITPTSARWHQAFTTDGGETWDTTWTMQHRRRE